MRVSELFSKPSKTAPKNAESVNHRLLVQGGYVEQLMAGVFSFLPLGWRVYKKIEDIIREEMDAIGGQETLLPAMHPRSIWDKTGRWESARDVMYQFKDLSGRELGLGFTHEEIVASLAAERIKSYRDLPTALYQIQTKYRQELRAKSGILRGREFQMKDLYSFHTDEKDRERYYDLVKHAYFRIFKRVDLDAIYTLASGGLFSMFSHEFQVLAEAGEDTIYYCARCRYAENKEIAKLKDGAKCPSCKKGKMVEAKSIEVGNIFPLGTRFSAPLGVRFLDKDGKSKTPVMASYGIGLPRLMGTIVEIHHDDKGIIWPDSVAPFNLYLIGIGERGKKAAEKLYKKLGEAATYILYDDRQDSSAGEQFATCDLLGIPRRITISDSTLDKGGVELKKRTSKATKIIKESATPGLLK